MRRTIFGAAATIFVLFLVVALQAQRAIDGPQYTNDGRMLRPANYREWIFLSSGLDMNYNTTSAPPERHTFTNVFVDPSSYRSFQQTGKWADGTVLVLEVRNAGTDAQPNKAGHFQTDARGMEAHVKDSRFADGWAFFSFEGADVSAAPLAGDRVARCVECHVANGAVERTFVQFYPTLLEIARQKGTLNIR